MYFGLSTSREYPNSVAINGNALALGDKSVNGESLIRFSGLPSFGKEGTYGWKLIRSAFSSNRPNESAFWTLSFAWA